MAELGPDRSLALAGREALSGAGLAKGLGDMAGLCAPKCSRTVLPVEPHGRGRRRVARVFAAGFPEVRYGPAARCVREADPPEDALAFCFRFRSGACLKLMTGTLAGLWISQ